MWFGRGVGAFWLMISLCSSLLAEPLESPLATWEGPGLRFEVRLAKAADVQADRYPTEAMVLLGLVAIPVTMLMTPLVAPLGPVFLVVAPTLQSRFNAQTETLEQVLATENLAQGIVDAVRSRWVALPAGPATDMQMKIVGYGLATRSRRQLAAMEREEHMCLVADAWLEWRREGTSVSTDHLGIGFNERSPDAPPPLCLPLDRWAEAGGTKLRQGLHELAAVLGAMAVARAADRP